MCEQYKGSHVSERRTNHSTAFEMPYGTLQWRHNERDGVSNHRLDCLLSRLFRRRSKKTSTLRVTGLCDVSPHKESVTRKMFFFDDVIMKAFENTDVIIVSQSIMWRLSTTMRHTYLIFVHIINLGTISISKKYRQQSKPHNLCYISQSPLNLTSVITALFPRHRKFQNGIYLNIEFSELKISDDMTSFRILNQPRSLFIIMICHLKRFTQSRWWVS